METHLPQFFHQVCRTDCCTITKNSFPSMRKQITKFDTRVVGKPAGSLRASSSSCGCSSQAHSPEVAAAAPPDRFPLTRRDSDCESAKGPVQVLRGCQKAGIPSVSVLSSTKLTKEAFMETLKEECKSYFLVTIANSPLYEVSSLPSLDHRHSRG